MAAFCIPNGIMGDWLLVSIEINYETSIKGQLTNQPFIDASYNTFVNPSLRFK